MPTVALVDGVKIQFYPEEHPPPHFHVEFAEYRGSIEIDTLRFLKGSLPPAKYRAVVDWASSRHEVLRLTFERAISKQFVGKIP